MVTVLKITILLSYFLIKQIMHCIYLSVKTIADKGKILFSHPSSLLTSPRGEYFHHFVLYPSVFSVCVYIPICAYRKLIALIYCVHLCFQLTFKKIVLVHSWFQFSSVAQSCPTVCDHMDCSTPGFPVHHQLPELAQIHVHWVSDAIPSSSVIPFSHCLQSLPASGSFLMSHFFALGGQRVRVSASASVLPVNIQLVYNVVLVSGIQKSESVIYIHISTLL